MKKQKIYFLGATLYRMASPKYRTKVSKDNVNKLIDKFYGEDFPYRKKLIKDVRRGFYRHGGQYIDSYFKFNFFKLNKLARKEYSLETQDSLISVWDYFNDQKYAKYTKDKYLFEKTFDKFLKRKYLLFDKDTKFEEFNKFVLDNDVFFKPRFGMLGIGAFKKEIHSEAEAKELFNKLHNEGSDYVIEELVINEDTLREFHPASVNTLRIVSIVTKHGPEILCAYQRFGNNGSDQDHSSQGAIQALVDLETGIISSSAIDKYNKPYIKHPYSQKKVPGYQLKNWDQCINMVKEMAMVVPQIRMIGWDVTINNKEEWVVIEGNDRAGFEAVQTLSHGLQPEIEKIIFEDEQ